MTKYRLGDTIRVLTPPIFSTKSMDESLREWYEEEAWRNGFTDEMPAHIKAQQTYIILDTQEKVDEANAGKYE